MNRFIMAIHGGAGAIDPSSMTQRQEESCHRALGGILQSGYELLRENGSALDAVELAARLLEDCELFNAGRGAVLTSEGTVELDAAIMDGRGRRAGAVAGVCRIKNPVRCSRKIMERTPHLLLAGQGAEAFAKASGLEMVDPEYFVTPHRMEQWKRIRSGPGALGPCRAPEFGTVGAVALDRLGHLAAATSTGGIAHKLPGRIGDTPLIGAGTWADDATCAVSGTGDGEFFVRAVFAHEIDALMRLGGLDLMQACRKSLQKVRELGGCGGCIAVDQKGNVVMPFTSSGMYRGWIGEDGVPHTAISDG